MRVFLAGATGALGRPLTRALLAAGHEVVGTTRTPSKADALAAMGAKAVVVDAMDPAALRAAVLAAEPDAVLDELTDLPQRLGMRAMRSFYDRQLPLKQTASPALHAAAREVGAGVHIVQSVAFAYAPGGAAAKSEDDAPYADPPKPWDEVMPVFARVEEAVATDPALTGMVLRYGFFYGPGTHYATDGGIAELVRRRQYPLVGDGGGLHSFIHVDDAATGTVAALERGRRGIYNIVDDEPIAMNEWLPLYAEALGAKPPRRVPAAIARTVAGAVPVHFATTLRGASNAKARRELAWAPAWPSVRTGFAASVAG